MRCSPPLLSGLGLLVNGHVPAEGVAVAETEILRDITDRYGELTIQASGARLKKRDYYYRLHLDEATKPRRSAA